MPDPVEPLVPIEPEDPMDPELIEPEPIEPDEVDLARWPLDLRLLRCALEPWVLVLDEDMEPPEPLMALPEPPMAPPELMLEPWSVMPEFDMPDDIAAPFWAPLIEPWEPIPPMAPDEPPAVCAKAGAANMAAIAAAVMKVVFKCQPFPACGPRFCASLQ